MKYIPDDLLAGCDVTIWFSTDFEKIESIPDSFFAAVRNTRITVRLYLNGVSKLPSNLSFKANNLWIWIPRMKTLRLGKCNMKYLGLYDVKNLKLDKNTFAKGTKIQKIAVYAPIKIEKDSFKRVKGLKRIYIVCESDSDSITAKEGAFNGVKKIVLHGYKKGIKKAKKEIEGKGCSNISIEIYKPSKR